MPNNSDPESRNTWLQRVQDDELRNELKSANLLLLPEIDFNGSGNTVYAKHSQQLFNLMKAKGVEGCDIWVESPTANFNTYNLHSTIIDVGYWIVDNWESALVLTTYAIEFYKKIESKRKTGSKERFNEPADLKFKLAVDDNSGDVYIREFRGSNDKFNELTEEVARLNNKHIALDFSDTETTQSNKNVPSNSNKAVK